MCYNVDSYYAMLLDVSACSFIISRFLLQDHDLFKKIEHELKMRDGSAKMLAAAKYTPQQLEAAKSLLTSNCRMSAYIEYLQDKDCQLKRVADDGKSKSRHSLPPTEHR